MHYNIKLGNLRPLRPDLMAHHKIHHKNEPTIKAVIEKVPPDFTAQGYYFYGKFIFDRIISQSALPQHFQSDNYIEGTEIGLADMAAIVLERSFGTHNSFDSIWSFHQNISPVAWDQTNDRIIATTNNGNIFSFIGTNLIEAAVYLTRSHEYLSNLINRIYSDIKYSPFHEYLKYIPSNSRLFIEAQAMDPYRFHEEKAYSILDDVFYVRFFVPNLNNFNPLSRFNDLALLTAEKINDALKNVIGH